MDQNKRPRRKVLAPSRPIVRQGLSFPAALIQPQQSQVARSEDDVSSRILQLDLRAQQLGEGFGIPLTTYELSPYQDTLTADSTGWAVAATVLVALAHRADRVTLERKNGRWGLYYTKEPAVISQERSAVTVPLKDAPLDVRERFLVQSEAFFRQYLKLCEDRLGRMRACVTAADQTLQLLDAMTLR